MENNNKNNKNNNSSNSLVFGRWRQTKIERGLSRPKKPKKGILCLHIRLLHRRQLNHLPDVDSQAFLAQKSRLKALLDQSGTADSV